MIVDGVSTGQPQILFAVDILKHKPETRVTLKGPGKQVVILSMLVDTGADVTVIPFEEWPKEWPLTTTTSGVLGIGGVQSTQISVNLIEV